MRLIDKLQQHGIRRLGTPKSGFRYVGPHGRPVPAAEAARIRDLRLPPAWTDVFVSPVPGAKLQAIGKDRAGRWQYRYHPDFARSQAGAKYRRLLRFAAALPRIHARVARDMRRRGLGKERILATMVHVLERCFMRPGSDAYAVENRSYGLATVRPRHVRVEGDKVTFDYRGKSGRRQRRELEDRRVARLVTELLRVPGRDVFKWVEADGIVTDVRRRHLNEYIRAVSGAPYTAKDFRTWAGTLLCATALARAARELVPGRTSPKAMANAAVKVVAARLGNTPAVARSAYISPAVLDGFAKGKVVACDVDAVQAITTGDQRALDEAEAALTTFLRAASPRASTPAAIVKLAARAAKATRTARPTGASERSSAYIGPVRCISAK